ncbi:MAG: type II toxin-antitoxin system VapC family toxin [Verrucomicrobia bacterium]|nr:MAG: type II toxin-antitoxin system VapC family toxin [Verrucomicrobiota bacterium]
MAWLLDTNAWITYLKTPQSSIRTRLQSLRPSDVMLCSVVKAKLLHGAEKYGNRERRFGILRELFSPYVSLPFDDDAAAQYGRMRHELEVAGNIIGPNDLMIAAIAVANDHTLVTHNTAEFSRVRGLALEDWQK